MDITPTTPTAQCREYVAECLGWVLGSLGWWHREGETQQDHPIECSLNILDCLPPGWTWEASTFSWWAYRIKDRLAHQDAGEQQVARTANEPDDAALLVALAWQEHKKEAPSIEDGLARLPKDPKQ